MTETARRDQVIIRNLILGYGGEPVVHNLSLTVASRQLHALVGENGAGKTTVLKAIAGLVTPMSGMLQLLSRTGSSVPTIGMVLQHDVLPRNLSVASCINCAALAAKQSISREKLQSHLLQVGLTVSPDSIVSTLSMHQRQLLQLACALATDPDILLLDEPTAVMSQHDATQFWHLIRTEASLGRTVIIATHKLEDVIAYCSHVSVMRGGKLVFTQDVPSVSIQEIILGMTPASILEKIESSSEHDFCDKPLVVKMVSASSEIRIHQHEIHGIAGLDGSGYGEWLSALALGKQTGIHVEANQRNIDSLSISNRRELGIGYVPADRHTDAIVGNETLIVNLAFGKAHRSLIELCRPLQMTLAKILGEHIVTKYDVRPADIHRNIDTFSGGNQQKFVVGRELERDNTVIVMNQPTRGLDRVATAAISGHIRAAASDAGKAFLIYSDDLNFLLTTCHQISTFSNGQLTQTRPVTQWTEQSLVEAIV